ncbi:hypothetical protein C0993_005014 [Termitomyces sp. T159_Od127]|nr:hypothetical protein C0993_005014 [Termitomyces sp. T159_Od127]
MAHQFSNEIYSMIVDNLQAEVSTLRRVSFVNRAFAASSRLYLWRRVTLKHQPTSNHVSSCAEFYEILTGGALTPGVADLVQEFCIDGTELPSTLSSDVHLPRVLDRLSNLTRLDIFNMSWPTDNNNRLLTSIRRILRSASLEGLTMVSLEGLALPTYLIDDCLAVRTLRLKGNYILENPLSVTTVQTHAPRPQNLILDLDPSIMVDVWPRIDTSYLQSLVIQLPTFEENMIVDGHALQCLGLNYSKRL